MEEGERKVHPHEFDILLEKVRNLFWNDPLISVEYDAATYVTERPPIGSCFQPDGSYVTPDGMIATRVLRQELTNLRDCYRKVSNVQQRVNHKRISEEGARRRLTEIGKEYHSGHTFPNTLPVQEWKGRIPPGVDAHIKGRVKIDLHNPIVSLRPRDIDTGPLYWEVHFDYSELLSNDSENE